MLRSRLSAPCGAKLRGGAQTCAAAGRPCLRYARNSCSLHLLKAKQTDLTDNQKDQVCLSKERTPALSWEKSSNLKGSQGQAAAGHVWPRSRRPALEKRGAAVRANITQNCASPAWWPQRGAPTRSHPELGRETPQRQWYCILRCGRVGRRQACKTQLNLFNIALTRVPPFGLHSARAA